LSAPLQGDDRCYRSDDRNEQARTGRPSHLLFQSGGLLVPWSLRLSQRIDTFVVEEQTLLQ